MPHISQIYNLTSMHLEVISGMNSEERARASSATREQQHTSSTNGGREQVEVGAPPNMFE